jgi:hypothetical protein
MVWSVRDQHLPAGGPDPSAERAVFIRTKGVVRGLLLRDLQPMLPGPGAGVPSLRTRSLCRLCRSTYLLGQ